MTHVVVCPQQKGGEGKTTTTVNLAAALAMLGKRVLLFDSDPQANATSSCFVMEEGVEYHTSYKTYGTPLSRWDVYELEHGFDLVPSETDLAAIEWEFNFKASAQNAFLLTKTLESIIAENRYDFIIVDLPPTLGTLTINGLVAATNVFIPLHPEQFGVDGIQELLKTILGVRETNPNLKVNGVLLTKVMNNSLHRDIEQETREFFAEIGIPVFETKIMHTPYFGKAVRKHVPAVIQYKNNLRVRAYLRFVKEAFGL